MRIELRRFVQTRGNSIVISPNRDGVQASNPVDGFERTRSISDDIAATKHRVVTGVFCPLDACLKRFDVGVDVTEDEIAHGVLCFVCDSERSWESLWSWRCSPPWLRVCPS